MLAQAGDTFANRKDAFAHEPICGGRCHGDTLAEVSASSNFKIGGAEAYCRRANGRRICICRLAHARVDVGESALQPGLHIPWSSALYAHRPIDRPTYDPWDVVVDDVDH